MKTTLKEVRQAFTERVKGVSDLVSFDDVVLKASVDTSKAAINRQAKPASSSGSRDR
jgi:hypothetical protein